MKGSYVDISQLTTEELFQLHETILDILWSKRNLLVRIYSVGDEVKFLDRKKNWRNAKVIRVNEVTCTLVPIEYFNSPNQGYFEFRCPPFIMSPKQGLLRAIKILEKIEKEEENDKKGKTKSISN